MAWQISSIWSRGFHVSRFASSSMKIILNQWDNISFVMYLRNGPEMVYMGLLPDT